MSSVIVGLSPCKLLWWLPEENTQVPHIPPSTPRVLGKDLYLIQLSRGGKMRALSAAAEPRGPFNKPDLILTVVNGQKPRCVRVATVADLSQTSGALSSLGRAGPCTSKW